METIDKLSEEQLKGLAKLREPFPPHLISKLPKPTSAQTDAVKQDFKAGIRCDICGSWHHPKVIHLDYVGHAALTDRLLDCDIGWNWEPLAFDEKGALIQGETNTTRGLPVLDKNGGLWIKLTVCGLTRLGYGDAQGKDGGDAMKERIGDALRNAAMRFGAALDLWHKGDLHADEKPEPELISAEQKQIILNELSKAKYPLEEFLKKASVKSLDEIPDARFKGCLTHIQAAAQTTGA